MDLPFSQRLGLNPIKRTIQVNSMDKGLRIALWNDFTTYVWGGLASHYAGLFCKKIWTSCFDNLLDEAPSNIYDAVKERYFTLEWYEVYDFLEFIAQNIDEYRVDEFIAACNATLKRELSAYRFVGKKLVQMASEEENAEVEKALLIANHFTPHLDRALDLLADRQTPDYRNSMKEAISAVEAICQLIAGSPKATLGKSLSLLEGKIGSVHPALKEAFGKLYGYTNDAQGIRHALLGESNLDVEDARFMLITCSAFINYLVAKADKAGITLPDN